ncbi:uncharacterized protein LOC126784055 [Argentina anserina]|uniref:uncharacterized protein LOC126784055 n=1 Tax=Argentina anserina TaxID=57926 RepID=UPI00217694F0|nr:uncharacterized protein LOC126784055 [Potentilla anserina]
MNSNWFSQWNERRCEDDEDDEENDAHRRRDTTQVLAEAAGWLATNPLQQQPQWGGSVPGRATLHREREVAHQKILRDYFVADPVYPPEMFRRRYRMRREVFLRMLDDVQAADPYFRQSQDCAGRLGFSPHQKLTCAIRMLATACAVDSLDESFSMPQSTWKNCQVGWQDNFSGKSKKPTIVLEAVAGPDTWIWHAFFGIPGAQNDITVLGRSPLFDALVAGQSQQLNYNVNGTAYEFGYYLANGIYPKWATLVQSIKHPENDAEVYFSTKQEAYRKDVERAFGILQARFIIVRQPARGWERDSLLTIMLACIILHNMIVEDERDDYYNGESDDDEPNSNMSRRARAKIYDDPNLPRDPRTGHITMVEYMSRYRRVRSRAGNNNLRNDLVQHVWSNRRQ